MLSYLRVISTVTVSVAENPCVCTEAGVDGGTEEGSHIHRETSQREGIKVAAEEMSRGDICSSSGRLFPEASKESPST